MVLHDGLVQCTDVMHVDFCFVRYIGRDGKYFKVGFLIEALFRVYQWPHIWCVIYLCKGSDLPSNPNSGLIHHATFFSLNFI